MAERDVSGGWRSVEFELVEDIPGAVSDITFTRTENGVLSDIKIRVDFQGAATPGEAFSSIGHELGHLNPRVDALSPTPGIPGRPWTSPQEQAAERYGDRTRRFFGL